MSNIEKILNELESDDSKYRGYSIVGNYKTIWHKNKISGHEWSTNEPISGFHVIGKFIDSRDSFSTVTKAKEAIDFAIKFASVIPRSDREIAKAKKLGLPTDI